MSSSNPASGEVKAGHYARKQILSRSSIIAWSHRQRFRLARRLVEPYAGTKLLDYGCGDGTFLAAVRDIFPDAVGADVDEKQAEDCRRRFADAAGRISFVLTADLQGSGQSGEYGVITCMEVLEHCVAADVSIVLNHLRRLAAPGGVVVISVPIEIGPTLAMKQLVRAIAGWRSHGDYRYRERYSPMEFWRMVFAGEGTEIERPVYDPNGRAAHGHKGFNWRRLRRHVRERFEVEATFYSPIGWSGGFLSSQAWLVAKPR